MKAFYEPTKVARPAQIASPPGGGEVPRWSAWDPPPLCLPGARESGDSCASRKPPRERRGPEVARVGPTS
eukprot:8096663-Pyramimonas_sp.AAC.1